MIVGFGSKLPQWLSGLGSGWIWEKPLVWTGEWELPLFPTYKNPVPCLDFSSQSCRGFSPSMPLDCFLELSRWVYSCYYCTSEIGVKLEYIYLCIIVSWKNYRSRSGHGFQTKVECITQKQEIYDCHAPIPNHQDRAWKFLRKTSKEKPWKFTTKCISLYPSKKYKTRSCHTWDPTTSFLKKEN